VIEPTADARRAEGWITAATPLVTFVVLGLPAGAIGVAWPAMRSSFAAPLAGLGLLLAGVTIAYFLGSAISGPLGARVGGMTLLIVGCALAGLGELALSVAWQWWLVPVFGVFVGSGSGLIDASVNTRVSLHRGIRYMGWLHASWAVGAAFGPQLVSGSLALTGSWRPAFATAGLAFLACALLASTQRRQWSTARDANQSTLEERRVAGYRGATVVLAGLLLLGAALEATTGDWSYSQLTLGRGIGFAIASLGASLFWAGLAAGRMALGVLGHRLPPARLLDLSILSCVLAAGLFWLFPAAIAAVVALPALGLGVSLLYPLVLSLTPARVGTEMTGHSVGYGLAVGTIGGGALPAGVGVILQSAGLWTLGPILFVMAVVLLLLHLLSREG
jgi:fucose permease